MSMKRKDLLGMADLERAEIEEILASAESFKEVATRGIKKVPTLRGRTVVNLFFEPSTRTQVSFELAAKRLSADVVTVSAKTSSVAKGESLLDTARNLEAMKADLMVLRHSAAGAPHLLARHLSCGVINAGDGMHEHPTQALLDLYTIREKKERITGLTVAIIGDIAHSRVARSAIHGLTTLGAAVRVVGPATMIPQGIERLGATACHTLDEGLVGADVVMALRLQLERHGDDHGLRFPSVREYARLYGITRERLKVASPDVLVLHPGPINRGIELSPEVADGVASGILDQVTNGIAVRMAVLYLFAGRAPG